MRITEFGNTHGTMTGESDPDRPSPAPYLSTEFISLDYIFGLSTLGTASCSSGKSVKLTVLRDSAKLCGQ